MEDSAAGGHDVPVPVTRDHKYVADCGSVVMITCFVI